MTMLVSMILVMYGILCILSYEFNKNHNVVIYMSISLYYLYDKYVWIDFLSVNKVSVCMSVCVLNGMVKIEEKHICSYLLLNGIVRIASQLNTIVIYILCVVIPSHVYLQTSMYFYVRQCRRVLVFV